MLLAAAVLGATPSIADRRAMLDQGKVLNAELALAKSNKSYFWIDISAKRIELRIQGVIIKTWGIAGYSQWGRPVTIGSFKLIKKEALRTPKRKNITPAADKDKNAKIKSSDLDVLELKDMPGRFNFEFEKGITMRFKAVPHKLAAKTIDFLSASARSLCLPLKTIAEAVHNSDFTDIQIVLGNESDAQSIYWTAEEGMSILILLK